MCLMLTHQVLPRPKPGPGHRRRSACSSSPRSRARRTASRAGGGRPAQQQQEPDRGAHQGVPPRRAAAARHETSASCCWKWHDHHVCTWPVTPQTATWMEASRPGRASAGTPSFKLALRLMRTASTNGRLSMRVPGMRRPCQNACAGALYVQQDNKRFAAATIRGRQEPRGRHGAPRRAVLSLEVSHHLHRAPSCM